MRKSIYFAIGALTPVAALINEYLELDNLTGLHWAKLVVAGLIGGSVALSAKLDNK